MITNIFAIKTSGNGVYTFRLTPNVLSGRFRTKLLEIEARSYGDAYEQLMQYTSSYAAKPKRLAKFTNATVKVVSFTA